MSDEAVDFRPDGTITCTVGEKRYRLRRPLLGELRTLLESLAQSDEDALDVIDTYRDELEELAGRVDAEDRTERRAARRERRGVLGKQTREVEAIRAVWIREAFALLAKPALPDPATDDPTDGLEPWMVGVEIAVSLAAHWRAVPAGPGGPLATGAGRTNLSL